MSGLHRFNTLGPPTRGAGARIWLGLTPLVLIADGTEASLAVDASNVKARAFPVDCDPYTDGGNAPESRLTD